MRRFDFRVFKTGNECACRLQATLSLVRRGAAQGSRARSLGKKSRFLGTLFFHVCPQKNVKIATSTGKTYF